MQSGTWGFYAHQQPLQHLLKLIVDDVCLHPYERNSGEGSFTGNSEALAGLIKVLYQVQSSTDDLRDLSTSW